MLKTLTTSILFTVSALAYAQECSVSERQALKTASSYLDNQVRVFETPAAKVALVRSEDRRVPAYRQVTFRDSADADCIFVVNVNCKTGKVSEKNSFSQWSCRADGE